MRNECDTKSLAGEVLKYIDIDPEKDEILLTTESGRQILIHHVQDCYESVAIEGTDGEWRELVGKPLVEVTQEETEGGEPPSEYSESWTRTTLMFKVNDATVISRWIGESNGYYSESVDICELTRPMARDKRHCVSD